MQLLQIFGYPREEITNGIAQRAGVLLAGAWYPCVHCSESKIRRYSVTKATANHADKHAGRIFVELAGPFNEMSLSRSRLGMMCIHDFTRFRIVYFLRHMNDIAVALRHAIATNITPAGLKVDIIRIDDGGEFKGQLQILLDELGILHERSPAHAPHRTGLGRIP